MLKRLEKEVFEAFKNSDDPLYQPGLAELVQSKDEGEEKGEDPEEGKGEEGDREAGGEPPSKRARKSSQPKGLAAQGKVKAAAPKAKGKAKAAGKPTREELLKQLATLEEDDGEPADSHSDRE